MAEVIAFFSALPCCDATEDKKTPAETDCSITAREVLHKPEV